MLYFTIATIVLFLCGFIYYYISLNRKEGYVSNEYSIKDFSRFRLLRVKDAKAIE